MGAVTPIGEVKRDISAQAQAPSHALQRWYEWRAEAQKLSAEILARRHGTPIDVDAITEAAKADLEARHDYLFET